MKKILVTGATGFIGQHFMRHLTNSLNQVRVLLRHATQSKSFSSDIEIFFADICDPLSLVGICNNIDTVFHLAGRAHVEDDDLLDNNNHHLTNFIGTKNLLHAAIKAKVKRFIYFSSVKAVRTHPSRVIDETYLALPTSAYGRAKRSAEKILLEASRRHDMHVVILRPALVYGPACKGNLARLLYSMSKVYFPPLPPIKNVHSMVSVDDVCRAALLSANLPLAKGKTYFVTDAINYSSRDIYELIATALGKPIPNWYIPLTALRLLAKMGDRLQSFTERQLPFNSATIEKMFGWSAYSSNLLIKDLNFKAQDTLKASLPKIVANYKEGKI